MNREKPFAGIRVLDLTRVLAGPLCTQNLADLGAEVIKIENPSTGDETRHWGPPYWGNPENLYSAYFTCVNRGKKSVCVDFKNPVELDKLKRLIPECDVIIENHQTGKLAKYGLDYASVKALKPDIVYCSITGFGQTGTLKNKPGYDYLLQGMCGLMSVTGHPPEEPNGEPVKVGVAVVDLFTGLYACNAVAAALFKKERTGCGECIDLSLFDSAIALLANQGANYLASGKNPERLGNAHPNISPYQCFPTSNGSFILTIGNDEAFARFCRAVDRKEWAEDKRFCTNRGRVENRKELSVLITSLTRLKTTQEWIEILERENIPCGPVNSIGEILDSDFMAERELKVNHENPVAGKSQTLALPFLFSGQRPHSEIPPPLLGEHTQEYLE